MGTWGTGISSNDTFSDVYDDFFKYYNEGDFPDEILKKLMIEYQEVLDNEDDFTNFWFAVAKAQWECKALEENIFNQIKWIVEEDIDINIWRNLDASEKDLKTRRNVLIKFLDSLKVEKAKELIMYDELSLSEIADLLNYSSVAHLSNQFKKITGFTPTHFKQIKEAKRTQIDKL